MQPEEEEEASRGGGRHHETNNAAGPPPRRLILRGIRLFSRVMPAHLTQPALLPQAETAFSSALPVLKPHVFSPGIADAPSDFTMVQTARFTPRTVHFWAEGAAEERRVLEVSEDVDAVRVRLPHPMVPSTTLQLCLHSRRTGLPVYNTVRLNDRKLLARRGTRPPASELLVFEPSDGPGEYELYWGCSSAGDAAVAPSAEWRAYATREARSLPWAHVGALEPRSSIGPPWPAPNEHGGYGARRFSLGNVRARIRVDGEHGSAGAVRCLVGWRRRKWPTETNLYLYHEQHPYDHIHNVYVSEFDGAPVDELVEIIFEPAHGEGEYLLYYLPYATRHATYDARDDAYGTTYEHARQSYDSAWWDKHLASHAARRVLPWALNFEIQARTPTELFDSMERSAMSREDAEDSAAPQQLWLLFPEDRRYQYKLTCQLPERWGLYGPSKQLQLTARPGEFHVWQVGVFGSGASVHVLDCRMKEARYRGVLSPTLAEKLSLHCFNLKGVGHRGQHMNTSVAVSDGCVRSLWFGVHIPLLLPFGSHGDVAWQRKGNMTLDEMHLALELVILAGNGSVVSDFVNISFRLRGQPVDDFGDSQRWRLSRLRWLDSTLGRGERVAEGGQTSIPQPFLPLRFHRDGGRGLSMQSLMSHVLIGKNGLPAQLAAGEKALHQLIEQPIEFSVRVGDGNVAWLHEEPASFVQTDADVVRWSAGMISADRQLKLAVSGEYWFDGQVVIWVNLTALREVTIHETELRLVISPGIAKYMMGFGKAGRSLAANTPHRWVWAAGEGNYLGWVGDVHAGIRLKLLGPSANFESPQHILAQHELPESWHNDGRGSVSIGKDGKLSALGGSRRLHVGASVSFSFELLMTPLKPAQPKRHFEERYYQVGYPDTTLIEPTEVAAHGATVLNIHQGVDGMINPFINYPFDRVTRANLAAYVNDAHKHNLLVKAYYTIRELSNHVDELYVLRSLGDEVLATGEGGGDPWVNEHLGEGYRACWQNPLSNGDFDSALCNNGLSRWANYYIEGLRELLRPPVQLDGIYYDGIAFGIDTMRRVRRLLDAERTRGLVDLHCGNNFLGTQYGMVSPALQFMHLMAYVDSLWFGEGYDYNEDPDYWLVEVSGLPFGLMGDMMREGNPWRGMLYGMGPRFRGADPTPIWHLWDLFGIGNSTMHGYWSSPPVQVLEPCISDVRVTTYARHGDAALIILAGWNSHMRTCKLNISWDTLGINPSRATLRAPDLGAHLGQRGADIALALSDLTPSIDIKPEGGAMLLLHSFPGNEGMVETDGEGNPKSHSRGELGVDSGVNMATQSGPLGVEGEHLHAAEALDKACRTRGGVHCAELRKSFNSFTLAEAKKDVQLHVE